MVNKQDKIYMKLRYKKCIKRQKNGRKLKLKKSKLVIL